ncbi:MAG: FHA domain-containing protein, partial [Anaerolineales bacterium]
MAFSLRDAQGREVPVVVRLQIGRDPINQIPIDDPLASRVHATVWEDSGKLFVRDEQSSNGTFVNGKRIQETRLRPRDQIQIGNSVFQVAAASGAQPAAAADGARSAQPKQPVQRGESPAPAAVKPEGHGGGRWLLAGCLVLILAGCGAGVGGYLAYRGGMLTPEMVLGLVGLGPAEIEVDNFRDDTVYVSIVQLDA